MFQFSKESSTNLLFKQTCVFAVHLEEIDFEARIASANNSRQAKKWTSRRDVIAASKQAAQEAEKLEEEAAQ